MECILAQAVSLVKQSEISAGVVVLGTFHSLLNLQLVSDLGQDFPIHPFCLLEPPVLSTFHHGILFSS